jgi:hypothetical protein
MGSIILSSAYSRRDCLGISLFAVFSHSGSRTRRVGVLTILSYGEAGFVPWRSERRYRRGATVNKYHIVPSSMGATVLTSWVENTNHE